MSKTKIEWTEHTWNVVTGCTKVSQGCKNCYAEKMFKRLVAMGSDDYLGRKFTDVKFHFSRLNYPSTLRKPSKIFVNSMSDLFHEKISFDEIRNIWDSMVANPQHTYQILTKRPERLLGYCEYESDRLADEGYEKINRWAFEIPDFIWVGTSAETQKNLNERLPLLLKVNAKVKILSLEPLLGEIKIPLDMLKQISWVIIGAESIGLAAGRECKLWWIKNLVDECETFGVPVFVKQIHIENKPQRMNKRLVKDIKLFPKNLRVREYPKP
jgi:protein gp37